MKPRLRLPALAEHFRKKIAALTFKPSQDLRRSRSWLELVTVIKRRPSLQKAIQLQVGQKGANHQRPQVVISRQVEQTDVEGIALCEHLTHQSMHRLEGWRVAVNEVL